MKNGTKTLRTKFGYALSAYLIILMNILSPSSANCQATWTMKTAPSSPFTARNACAGFAIGTKGYFGTGSDVSGEKADWYEYDPATDSWTQKASFPGGVREAMICFSIGSKGYVGLGDIGGTTAFADFWEYDPSTDTWTAKANFPGGARSTAVGFSIGTKGYVGCGDDFTNLKNDFYEYDPSTDTWTAKANFGGTARSDASGFSIGSKGYIGVGDDGGAQMKKDFWEYDPSTDTWIAKANFGGGNRTTATAFSLNSLGYIGAGDNGTALKKDFWSWDPMTNTWTAITNFSGASRSDMLGFAIGTKAYAGNGNTCGASCYLNDWYELSLGTVSVQEINKHLSKFNIFPNPTSEKLNISYESVNNNITSMVVFDVLGNKVNSFDLPQTSSNFSIDLSKFTNGIYYVQFINNGTKIGGEKLVITK